MKKNMSRLTLQDRNLVLRLLELLMLILPLVLRSTLALAQDMSLASVHQRPTTPPFLSISLVAKESNKPTTPTLPSTILQTMLIRSLLHNIKSVAKVFLVQQKHQLPRLQLPKLPPPKLAPLSNLSQQSLKASSRMSDVLLVFQLRSRHTSKPILPPSSPTLTVLKISTMTPIPSLQPPKPLKPKTMIQLMQSIKLPLNITPLQLLTKLASRKELRLPT